MPTGIYKRKSTQGFQKGHPPTKGSFKKGNMPWNKGKKQSEETKQKIKRAKNKFFANGGKPGNWKGGIRKFKCRDYERIFIRKPTHPFCRSNGYILRSHLVMEQMIGRYLRPEEVVHHINSDTLDDRPENLELFVNQREHLSLKTTSL